MVPVISARASGSSSRRVWVLATLAAASALFLALDPRVLGDDAWRVARWGLFAISASSSDEALEAIRRDHPNVLLSDIEMPGEEGQSLIRKVRALPADHGGDIPAAALTAHARGEDRQKALLAGFQVHVSKPVPPEELTAVIAELAGRRELGPTA